MSKIKEIVIKKKTDAYCWLFSKLDEIRALPDEVNNTKFTKKIPQKIATVCSALLVTMMPTVAFAAEADTSTLDDFIEFICSWLKKIGAVVMLVGAVLFALGWQRDDAEGKTRGLQTLMAGAMVVAIGASPDIFGL